MLCESLLRQQMTALHRRLFLLRRVTLRRACLVKRNQSCGKFVVWSLRVGDMCGTRTTLFRDQLSDSRLNSLTQKRRRPKVHSQKPWYLTPVVSMDRHRKVLFNSSWIPIRGPVVQGLQVSGQEHNPCPETGQTKIPFSPEKAARIPVKRNEHKKKSVLWLWWWQQGSSGLRAVLASGISVANLFSLPVRLQVSCGATSVHTGVAQAWCLWFGNWNAFRKTTTLRFRLNDLISCGNWREEQPKKYNLRFLSFIHFFAKILFRRKRQSFACSICTSTQLC